MLAKDAAKTTWNAASLNSACVHACKNLQDSIAVEQLLSDSATYTSCIDTLTDQVC